MTKKYSQPLMLEANSVESILNSEFKEQDLSNYTELVSPNTAKLKIFGPLMKHGSWWTDFFGLSAYSSITKEFKKLLSNSQIENIILDIDSPGGMVNGCGELASLIYNSRSKKNVVAYVSGLGCSAAYYLASATSKVYVNKSAKVGSIGVVACVNAQDENTKTIEIVSSKSKDKRLDAKSEEGKEKIQQEVDALADIFALDVAKFRSMGVVDIEQTNGGTFIGEASIANGLADEVSEFETILQEFSMEQTPQIQEQVIDTDAIVARERARASTISAKSNALGLTALGDMLIQSNLSTDESINMLEKAKEDMQTGFSSIAPQATDFAKIMNESQNPTIEAKTTDVDDEETLVNALASAANSEY